MRTAPSQSKKKDIAASYNQYKFFGAQQYTGMKVGRAHKWYYDQGVWIDKKLTPDKWHISYAVTKRRAGKAPKGSGVSVGTEYHWYIVAHQMVKKLDANSYSTAMDGYKFKLAHKRSESQKWNIGDTTQRNHLIKILQGFIAELQSTEPEEIAKGIQEVAAQDASPKAVRPKKKLLRSEKA